MKITAVSDLHGAFPKLSGGDLLIVAGDLTATDTIADYFKFFKWLHGQKYEQYVVIAGNHDNNLDSFFDDDIESADFLYKTKFLKGSSMEFNGFKIWGGPWTRYFEGCNPHCCAHMLNTEEELAEKWALIPDKIDILITHTPPAGYLDQTSRKNRVGSSSLTNELERIKPKLHVFGHIHEGYGMYRPNLGFVDCPGYPIFVNASHMNAKYQPVNPPIDIEL